MTLSIQYSFIEDHIYYQTFGEHLTLTRIDELMIHIKKYQWMGYAVIPLIILMRIFYTSVFLYIGVFFTEFKVEFSKLYKTALLADFVYVFSSFSRLIILIFFKEVNTLNDLQIQPLSVMELLHARGMDPLFSYPLSLLNIFELFYFLILAKLLVNVIQEANNERTIKFSQSLKLVTAYYGSGLLLWVLLVMFITLNLS